MARQHWKKSRLAQHVEHLEERRVMSADPLALAPPIEHFAGDDVEAIEHAIAIDDLPAFHHDESHDPPPVDQHILDEPDFWIDSSLSTNLDDYFDSVDQMLAQAHGLTGWFNVRDNYGFTGRGQTVAVIDSGIAWDHFALGGGFGAGRRVVGGWDFSEENDANPYDDGASGSHGTHVAGIVGSSHGTHTGVAPGVDLVGLRVFNDAGQGFFSWIENALRWVHNNRNNFANPITTVNLSLGVSNWNAATVPNWANLEDEFAQLKEDGIFIAVSAGNSYTSYNAPGLSYPAASPHVVPVMSTNDAGSMSSYSQRLSRAIAAPGQSIVSTVPDYNGNNNGATDDFGSKSGTSMAAPYVAGASVLIRQAMQFAGMTGITQDTIYNHMMATADSFFDSLTGQNYQRLNLGRAIDALMPADDYGSTAAAAYNMGAMSGPMAINGRIDRLTDVDCFSFTATSTGRVTFAANSTPGMTASWQVWGATPASGAPAGTLAFDVTAGQTYTVGISSPSGLGNYSLATTFEPTFTFTDWGSVAYNQASDVSVNGERWFRIVASRDGLLTVQGAFNAAAGAVNVALYNTALTQIAAGTTSGGLARVDVNAAAGGEYFVRVTGTNADVDFKLLNLVSQAGSIVTAIGTADADVFAFAAGATHLLSVNGVSYSFTAGSAAQFNIDGLGGADAIVLTGSTGADAAIMRVGSTTLTGVGYSVAAANFETQSFQGGGGADEATLYDSTGADTLTATPAYALLTGAGFSTRVDDVDSVTAYSNSAGGQRDVAFLHGGAGDDRYVGRTVYSLMEGAGFRNVAHGFDRVDAFAGAGNDQAFLYDSASDDTFTARPEYSVLSGADFFNVVQGFDRVEAISSLGGFDRAYLYDSAGDDMFVGRPEYAYISGSGFYNFARGFDRVDGYAFAGGSADRAYLYDSPGNDVFTGRPQYSLLSGAGFYNLEWSFEIMYSFATGGGRDIAYMYDSAGDDRYFAAPDYSYMVGGGFYYYAQYYEEVYAYAFAGGNDLATYQDSAGDDVYSCSTSGCTARTGSYVNAAYSFDNVRINATAGGVDRLDLRGVVSADAFFGRGGAGTLTRVGARVESSGFDEIALWLTAGAQPAIDNDAIDFLFSQVGG
jgi:subtilisin family serine protease